MRESTIMKHVTLAAALGTGVLMSGCAAVDRFEKGTDELFTPLLTEGPNIAAGALLRATAPHSADPQIGHSMDIDRYTVTLLE